MDTRRLIFAILISWAFIFLWYGVLYPPQPPVEEPVGPAVEDALEPQLPAGFTSEPAASEEAGSEAEAVPDAAGGETAAVAPVLLQADSEALVAVETESWRAEFSNRGGQLVSLRLARHEGGEGELLELVHPHTAAPYTYALIDPLTHEQLSVDDQLFVHALESSVEGGQTLTFDYSGPEGRVRKLYTFRDDGTLEVDVTAAGLSDWALLVGPGIRKPTVEELKNTRFRHGAVYRLAGDKEVLNAKKADPTALPASQLDWVALDDTYFLNAVIPRQGISEITLEPYRVQTSDEEEGLDRFVLEPVEEEMTDELRALSRELGMVVRGRGERMQFTAFWGGKNYQRLSALPYGLETTVDFGWFPWLARPLQLGLRWVYENWSGHNYGWAIVIMTILIRLGLLPLTHRSMVHMQVMQELNPKVQAVRHKYKGKLRDKQGRPNMEAQRKMNDEVMAVYREAGTNPVSGCLPMLAQFPVFLAFYYLLSGAIELRNAPWIFWIQDLAVPDPVYLLPIIMGGTQLLQQLMMPMGGDPMQRRLFLLLPFILTFVFLNFASGLVLYWLTSNVVTIVQQWFYRGWRERRSGGDDKGGGKGKKSTDKVSDGKGSRGKRAGKGKS